MSDEMRPEYDIRGGVRRKYVVRDVQSEYERALLWFSYGLLAGILVMVVALVWP